ncbi:glycosyltransferase family 4 protein [Desulfogranum marinum]|uniref:glycosyltransferase family 4 protein n=1 Tax=Desulfogranum marinum TaxID=453220 RepID=UPI001962C956|nr:glycosyltransferase family 4 protein [Desulfogranum marinum]MBM9514823.1 glycosyltransferase family 4 protein [Desulfogranum marinum]
MKILFANKFFYLNGGSETVFFQEREFFLANGHHVIDFSMQDEKNNVSPYSEFFIKKIDFQQNVSLKDKAQQAISFIHSSEAVSKLEQLIVQEKPDIAHLHNIYHQLTPSIIPVLKKHGVKIVVTLHDYKLICPSYLALKDGEICDACQGKHFWKPFTSNCQKSHLQGLLLSLEAYWHKWKRSYDKVDLFLSPSSFLADLIAKRITADKIQVLHNGIDTDKYQPNFSDQDYALYFGRLSKEKGITTLLQAHKNLGAELPLKIVGTGPLEEELRIDYPTVEFLGYQSGQSLHDIVANAAFVVVPSEWYENCSMVVLESMAFGKPVIGSRIGGIPEQVEDGKTGFLFEIGNVPKLTQKMTMLMKNTTLRGEMGRRAREKLKKEYSVDEHNEQLLWIYSTLLAT